ncbi:MAG: hypothetical protein ACLR7D_00020 [Lachnospira eligens]
MRVQKDFKAIAIVCSGDRPAYPCGIMQTESCPNFFNPDTRIIIEECSGLKTYTMSEILPDSFFRYSIILLINVNTSQ